MQTYPCAPVETVNWASELKLKNINSFRFVERAINFEIQRHIEILESGADIERETRLYDPERDETRAMKSRQGNERRLSLLSRS